MGSYGGGVGDGVLWYGSYGVGPMVWDHMVVVWVMGPMVWFLWFGSYGVGYGFLWYGVGGLYWWVVFWGNLK